MSSSKFTNGPHRQRPPFFKIIIIFIFLFPLFYSFRRTTQRPLPLQLSFSHFLFSFLFLKKSKFLSFLYSFPKPKEKQELPISSIRVHRSIKFPIPSKPNNLLVSLSLAGEPSVARQTMPQFTKPTFSLLLLIIAVVFTVSSITTVRSEYDSSIIRLPSEQAAAAADDDLCTPNGPGPGPAYCPVKCFRADPVCGVDGVTYWCGCADALCAGVKVAKLGFCEVGNGGPGPLSGQALLLVHIVWLIVLGFSVLFGLF